MDETYKNEIVLMAKALTCISLFISVLSRDFIRRHRPQRPRCHMDLPSL